MGENTKRTIRVLQEILGDVDVWEESLGGPDGPWILWNIRVRRDRNEILVEDVDGGVFEAFHVSEVVREGDDLQTYVNLRNRLLQVNKDMLAAL